MPKKDYPFRLICKKCNSYRHTTIEQFPRHGMLYSMIRLNCLKCEYFVQFTEERFDHEQE